jgi:hypothetical protein
MNDKDQTNLFVAGMALAATLIFGVGSASGPYGALDLICVAIVALVLWNIGISRFNMRQIVVVAAIWGLLLQHGVFTLLEMLSGAEVYRFMVVEADEKISLCPQLTQWQLGTASQVGAWLVASAVVLLVVWLRRRRLSQISS